MADQVIAHEIHTASDPEPVADRDGLVVKHVEIDRVERPATGKPYQWQLEAPERLRLLALPAEALAERSFVKARVFRSALERTAAYFVYASRLALYEGRDPLVITDDVRCGAVADLLSIDLDLLGRVLLEMQRQGMISVRDDGNLKIDNLATLDTLSEGQAPA